MGRPASSVPHTVGTLSRTGLVLIAKGSLPMRYAPHSLRELALIVMQMDLKEGLTHQLLRWEDRRRLLIIVRETSGCSAGTLVGLVRARSAGLWDKMILSDRREGITAIIFRSDMDENGWEEQRTAVENWLDRNVTGRVLIIMTGKVDADEGISGGEKSSHPLEVSRPTDPHCIFAHITTQAIWDALTGPLFKNVLSREAYMTFLMSGNTTKFTKRIFERLGQDTDSKLFRRASLLPSTRSGHSDWCFWQNFQMDIDFGGGIRSRASIPPLRLHRPYLFQGSKNFAYGVVAKRLL